MDTHEKRQEPKSREASNARGRPYDGIRDAYRTGAAEAIRCSLFTKPWKDTPALALAEWVKGVGFDGIELPVREGFQVEPSAATEKLPAFAAAVRSVGLDIFSVAARPDERIFAACAEAGVPMIRIMAEIGEDGYLASERRLADWLERSVAPLCRAYNVKVGIQQHHGRFVPDAAGLMRIVGRFEPELIGAVWDAAHDALAGQQPEYGIELLASHLAMVNLKNVYMYRSNGPEAESAQWGRHFTTGRHGMASWPRAAAYLKRRGYAGVVCLTAQYSDDSRTDRYIAEDLAYAKELFGGSGEAEAI
ncbi:sugar phosphate isomerase/epimerase family protein [Paenibacillus humicola]|uniref:sugar phosphate isomerase/epimerase family protein n=1 Tax=Paenibacillus humicola TaxID=3110540 RepID=UPI00237AE3FB|nr:sugar phosphate isomerase/epimerase [Paenibacillus humicola]